MQKQEVIMILGYPLLESKKEHLLFQWLNYTDFGWILATDNVSWIILTLYKL